MQEVILKSGWLQASMDRATKKVEAWKSTEIYRAQMQRMRERDGTSVPWESGSKERPR